jgi:phage terminase small subunit
MGGSTDKKLTLKQEAFCQGYVETGNASEAYRRAYDAAAMKDETIWRKAKECLDNGKVTARVELLQAKLAKRHEITVDSVAHELEDARAMAMAEKQPSAAVSASLGKAKLYGLIVDRSKVDLTTHEEALDQLRELAGGDNGSAD